MRNHQVPELTSQQVLCAVEVYLLDRLWGQDGHKEKQKKENQKEKQENQKKNEAMQISSGM